MLSKDAIEPSDPTTIARAAFLQVLENAKQRAHLLRKKYPTLKAYLVLTSGADFTTDPTQDISAMLKFPGLVVDDDAKAAVMEKLQQIKDLPKDAEATLMKQFQKECALHQIQREQLKKQIEELRASDNGTPVTQQTEPVPKQASQPVLKRAVRIAIEELRQKSKSLIRPEKPDDEKIQMLQKELNQQLKSLNRQLILLSANLAFRTHVLFELRFDHLDYEAIWQLQQDEAVDQTRTPQTRASIRIVLGSIGDFLPCDGAF